MKLLVYIIGSGGHARVISRSIALLGGTAIFIHSKNEEALAGESIDENEFLAGPPAAESSWGIICGLGSTSSMLLRKGVLGKYNEIADRFVTIAHPDAMVDQTAILAPGCYIGPGAVVGNNTVIGRHVIINTGSIVEHDVSLGENTHVASGAIILGGATIGANVHLGASATVLQGVRIGSNVVIGASSLCNRDIQESSGTWIGLPARKMGAH